MLEPPSGAAYRQHRRAFRRWRRKRQVVDLLGGRCSACDYEGALAEMHVHHTDPSRKTTSSAYRTVFGSSSSGGPLTEADLQELRTCELLCSVCHARHALGPGFEVVCETPDAARRFRAARSI